MPLLRLETSLSPEDLLGESAACRVGKGWWVLHAKPRAEKSIARQLVKHGVGFYLPLYEKRWRKNGRYQHSHLPLFPGYLFLCTDAEGRLRALETNQIVQTIPVRDEARLLKDLSRVHRLIQSGMLLTPEERLEPGQPVEIINGPLQGLQGKIVRRGKEWTFFIEVDFLQRGASVEIDATAFRPLE
jgi:transcription antitermination factor NusG